MSTPPMPLRSARKPWNLAKLATIFALIFSLAFGLCCVSGISLSAGGSYQAAHFLITTSLVIGALCLTALLALGVVAILRARRKNKVIAGKRNAMGS